MSCVCRAGVSSCVSPVEGKKKPNIWMGWDKRERGSDRVHMRRGFTKNVQPKLHQSCEEEEDEEGHTHTWFDS